MSDDPRSPGRGALVMIDLDGFKHINDTCGHVFGDTVLHQAAACIREIMPDNSLCGRFGGDEFLILVPDIAKEELPELLNALLRYGAETIKLPLSDTSFGMSIGAVPYPVAGKRFDGFPQKCARAPVPKGGRALHPQAAEKRCG